MALVFLKDALPAARPLFSAARGAAFVAAAAAALGVLLGALSGDFHGRAAARLSKALGVALLVGGIAYGVGAAGARDRARARAAFAWLASEPEALALAKAEGRPVIIDFWAEWCTACKELDRIAWSRPEVKAEASRFVAVKLDGTVESEAFTALAEKYGVVGMPTVIFIDPRGREVPERVMGAVPAEEMVRRLRSVDRACERPPAARPAGEPALAMACASRW
jgi:thiol:disulfide interchange protein DsbD